MNFDERGGGGGYARVIYLGGQAANPDNHSCRYYWTVRLRDKRVGLARRYLAA